MGMMLVRIYYKGDTEGSFDTWHTDWTIHQAMREWLSGEEWFEILGYYPDSRTEPTSSEVITQFKEAEKRAAICLSE